MSAPEPDIGLSEMNYVDLSRIKQTDDSSYQEQFLVAKIVLPNLDEAPKCSCVIFARWYLNREEIRGIAGAIKPSSQEPKIGSVVLLREGELGHTAVVIGIEGDTLYLLEANYTPCKLTTRQMKIGDSKIKGYI